MNTKPTVYIVSNFGGGVRKSTSMAHLTFALQDMGAKPIVVSLDTNNTLISLIKKQEELYGWDLNNEGESAEGLRAVVEGAMSSGRPVVLDLAALGGATKGVHTLLRTRILEICELVAIVPVLPSEKSIIEADRALRDIKPDRWILVQYDTRNNTNTYKRMPELQQLLKLDPVSVIKPEELTDAEALLLQTEEATLNEMHSIVSADPLGTIHLRVFLEYWNKLSDAYGRALLHKSQKDE